MSVPLRWQEPEEIQAPICIPAPAPRRRRASRRAHRIRIALGIMGFGLTMSACTALGVRIGNVNANATPPMHLVSVPRNGAQVALNGASLERHLGFATVTGSVASQTKSNLSRVEAVVELLDSQNRTVQTESALVAFDPLPAGQSAPFRVEMQDNPRAVAWRVRFRELLGGALD